MAKFCTVAAASFAATVLSSTPAEFAFEDFVAKYGRKYSSEAERAHRYKIFAENFARIEAENARGHSFTLGVNEFADQSPEEFRMNYMGKGITSSLKEAMGGRAYLGRHQPSPVDDLPDEVDWVAKGAVNTPMQQGKCGSCWTFSTTGALEGAWQISTGDLIKLSEQQLVDCAKNDGNSGCHGGDMELAFKYLEGEAVCTEDSYPYQAQDGTCTQDDCTAGIPRGGVTGYQDVERDNTDALMSAVAQQPVSVSIEADESVFQLYQGGVIETGCGSKLDHGVLVVGYGTDNGVDYWKIKNSWGPGWGEEGYVRIKRGLPADGECGIKAEPVYPVVSQAITTEQIAFESFIKKYGKTYATPEEEKARFEIFKANLAKIEDVNSRGYSYSLGVNEFADLTSDEFAASHFGMASTSPLKSLKHLGTHRATSEDVPDAVDWVEKGAVTDVKKQGSCGSCWTFSSMGALEGAWKIAGGELVSMSEQQLLDCATDGNQGCKGGSMDLAFKYLEDNAVCTDSSYSYKAQEGTCMQDQCDTVIPKGGVVGYKDVDAQDTDALKSAVAQQPVSVAIEADQSVFQLYQGGVIKDGCGSKLDHGVLIVGYGTDNGVDYWKVKNSWGPGWGEDGYVRIKRGLPQDGECGIKDSPVYSEVKVESTIVV